jgi:hypothetical protein
MITPAFNFKKWIDENRHLLKAAGRESGCVPAESGFYCNGSWWTKFTQRLSLQ